MVEEITRLDSPIDVMYLLHKAFRVHSDRTEELAAQAEKGGDLKQFVEAFDFWIKQLLYHATTEDKYMTGPLTDQQPARDNEAEHAELVRHAGDLIAFMEKGEAAGLAENVKAAMLALEEEQHKELVEKVQEVEEVLKAAIGEEAVIARTRRHLYRRVMELRILEFDHFENEEAFVCSIVREHVSERDQLDLARRLLIDEDAEDPRWVIDWVASELAPGEQRLLSEMEARFTRAVA